MVKKILGYSKKDMFRIVMHFFVGMFDSWLLFVFPLAGIILGTGFMFYEALEDFRIHDNSYIDMFGFLIGLGFGGFIIAVR